jgi:hypothetical protein
VRSGERSLQNPSVAWIVHVTTLHVCA